MSERRVKVSSAHALGASLVLDTNILLDDPRAIERLGTLGRCVIIPLCVLEELDRFKLEQSERGLRAREVTHTLDRLSAEHPDGLQTGLSLARGGRLRLSALGAPDEPAQERSPDLSLLSCALAERSAHPQRSLTVLTRDVNLRVRARFLGLQVASEEALNDRSDAPLKAPPSTSARPASPALEIADQPAWGLSAINDEQRLALHYLRAPEVSLVCLTGKAGTGKTLIALAAGLAQCLEDKRYERVLVSRAIFPLGRDIGYLPGTLEEKMAPWVQPVFDNLDFLLGQRPQRQPHRGRARAEELVELGVIEVSPITYIRGRSIPKQYMIIDEAQNLTLHEVKTILTRAGHGTKVVLIGDTAQIDHPYLSSEHNGLSYTIERFATEPCAAHVHLKTGERSPLAALAADLL